MADDFSFDVVSKLEMQAVDDAINAVNREITVRFDFRGSDSRAELDKVKNEIMLYSDNEGKIKNVYDIFISRAAKRGIDLKSFDEQKVESALGGKAKQLIKIIQGISTEKAKLMVADIKASKLKVNASIQSEQVRVTSKSKDALQQAMSLLKSKDYEIPVQFTNFR